jgi:hypothetical protein
MTYEGSVKFTYKSKQITPLYNSSFPELLPDESITIESDSYDLNIHQYFELFTKFVRALGFSEYNIMDAACGVAFNDCNSEENMRKLALEYDLILKEDQEKGFESHENEYDQRIKILEEQNLNLKAKLSRYENPDNPHYTDEEMDAMSQEKVFARKSNPLSYWNGLIPGSEEAKLRGCICPVLDNLEMPDDKKWIDVECPIHGRKKHD